MMRKIITTFLILFALGIPVNEIAASPSNWDFQGGFEYTMIIHLKIPLGNSQFIEADGSMVAAFQKKDDETYECRGVTTVYAGPAGNQFQLTVASNQSGESGFVMKAYDAATDQIYDIQASFEFKIDGVIDTISVPGEYPAKTVLVDEDDGVSVTEGGDGDSYAIVLNAQPSDSVTITVSSQNDDLRLNDAEDLALTFTSGDWNTTQSVTVSAIDNRVLEGERTATITHAITDAGDDYKDIQIPSIEVSIKDEPKVLIDEGNGVSVSEQGSTDTYAIVLNAQPTGNVEVTISAADNQITVNDAETITLEFTQTNWNQEQSITVKAVDDTIKEESLHTSAITHQATGGGYDGADIFPVVVSITDNDKPGVAINIMETEFLEGGTKDSYTLALSTQPREDVTITASSDGMTLMNGEENLTLMFTQSDWNHEQTISITAIDDTIPKAENPYSSTISHSASSDDPDYNHIAIQNVAVSIIDNDPDGEPADFEIIEPTGGLSVSEAGGTDSYQIRLKSQPDDTATIRISSDGQTWVNGKKNLVITFEPENWDDPQILLVSAVDDTEAGPHISTITHETGELPVQEVNVNVTSDDVTLSLTVSPDDSGTTLPDEAIVDEDGMPYRIKAVPNDGYEFSQWESIPVGIIEDPHAASTTVDTTVDATLTAFFIPMPSNDNFAEAIAISGKSGETRGWNVRATKESGERDHAGNAGGKSLWWTWTAPESDNFFFNTHGSEFDTLLAVYIGSTLHDLTEIGSSNDDDSPNKNSSVIFSAESGVQYYVAVDGMNEDLNSDPDAASSGKILLIWGKPPAPPVEKGGEDALPEELIASEGEDFSYNLGYHFLDPNKRDEPVLIKYGITWISGRKPDNFAMSAWRDDNGKEHFGGNWMTLDENGRLYGRPGEDDVGSYYIEFEIGTDDGGAISRNFNLVVCSLPADKEPPDDLPEEIRTVKNEAFSYDLDQHFSNADHHDLMYDLKWISGSREGFMLYAWKNKHGVICYGGEWLEMESDGMLHGTPGEHDHGEYRIDFEIKHTYGGASITRTFNLVVSDQFCEISGRVTAPDGEPLPGVYVEATDAPCGHGGKWYGKLETDAEGNYSFSELLPGDYYILVNAPYGSQTFKDEWWNSGDGTVICETAEKIMLTKENPDASDINIVLGPEKGDLNYDEDFTLYDAVIALQVCVGISPMPIYKEADVNGDGKLGIADAIHILQKLATPR